MTKDDLEYFRTLIQEKLAQISQEFQEQERNTRNETEQVASEDRSAYSLHSLYEQQRWELTPATAGYLSSYKQGRSRSGT